MPPATIAKTIDAGGVPLAVWDRPGGDGLPIVLIHGNTASKEVFRDLFAALAGRRIVAFDLPGCGESPDARDPVETYTLPALGRIVVEALRALDAERCILVGWSLGGHLAIQSLINGAKPAGIVLSGTPPCGPDPAEIASTFLPIEGAEVMSMPDPSEEQLMRFLALAYDPTAPSAAVVRDARRADGKLRQHLFEHIFTHPDLEPQRVTIANWPGPFALIQGRDEPFFRPAEVDRLGWKRLWRGGTQWIEGAGHAPFLTDPAGYAKLLADFARDVESGAV